MTNIIDFLMIKEQRQQQELEQLFQQANTQLKIERLLETKQLHVTDHQMFLAFLAYAQTIQLSPEQVFIDVLKYSKYEFQAKYAMNWYSIIQLTTTFLTILQSRDANAFQAFIVRAAAQQS